LSPVQRIEAKQKLAFQCGFLFWPKISVATTHFPERMKQSLRALWFRRPTIKRSTFYILKSNPILFNHPFFAKQKIADVELARQAIGVVATILFIRYYLSATIDT
jgi:hypothetical protein